MLDAMSKILVFSKEERELLGLIDGGGQPDQQLNREGLGDTLINYLLDDDDE